MQRARSKSPLLSKKSTRKRDTIVEENMSETFRTNSIATKIKKKSFVVPERSEKVKQEKGLIFKC